MVQIDDFVLQKWSNTESVKWDISSSYAKPISIDELASISESNSGDNGPLSASVLSAALGYGDMPGSKRLRNTLAGLYSAKATSPLTVENVLVTPGGSLANYVIFQTLCGKDDHVIVQYPTYQQLLSLPSYIGAEVSFWAGKDQDKWQLDVDELKSLIKPNTKMIVLTNPGNPTGAIIPRSVLRDIIEVAREHSIVVFCDEIYRPLFHSITPMDDEFPPSAISLGYDNVIVTGSMSKAYGLAGIRVGWLASRNADYVAACRNYRAYTTISVSQLDEAVATFALDGNCLHKLLKRNVDLAKNNLPLLETFIERHRWACDWVRPVASSVSFVRFSKMGKPVDDLAFCKQVHKKKGVLLAPGSHCFGKEKDFKGYVRIGYAMDTQILEAGLKALAEFMEEEYENVPVGEQITPAQ